MIFCKLHINSPTCSEVEMLYDCMQGGTWPALQAGPFTQRHTYQCQ